MSKVPTTATAPSTQQHQHADILPDLKRALAALPDAVTAAVKAALPDQYTPELADQIARDLASKFTRAQSTAGHFPWCDLDACITRTSDGDSSTEHVGTAHHVVFPSTSEQPLHLVAQLGYDPDTDDEPTLHLSEDAGNVSISDAPGVVKAIEQTERLAAALRRMHRQMTGTGPLTEAQTTLSRDQGLGVYRTAPVETEMRNVDSVFSNAERAQTPLFAAEIVVADGKCLPDETVDGRFTQMWVSHGTSTGEMSPAEAREIVQTARDFADRLEALCDRADEIAADDYQLDPEASRLKREAEDRRIRAVTEAR